MALREVLASFGIDVDDGKLKAAAAGVQSYESALKGLVTQENKASAAALDQAKAQSAVVAQLRAEFIVGAAKQVVASFEGMIKSSLDLAGSLGDTADKLGVTTTELQEFQFAGRISGVSADEMSQSLGFLNKNLGEAASGTGPAKDAFGKLGISVKDSNGHIKSATDLLPEIADKVNGLGSQGEKTATVMAIFGRSGANLLPLFKDGAKGIEEAQAKFKELGLEIDKNFITQAHDVGDQVETMHVQFDVLKTKLVGAALPTLKTLSEVVLKLGAGLGKLLENTNASIIVFAAFAGGALIAVIAGVRSLATALGVAEGELLLIVAIFAVVALVVEDIYTLFTGGDSIIGRFIDKMFGVGASKKFVEEVKKEALALWEQFKAILPALEELGGKLFDAFKLAAPYIAIFIKDGLQAFVFWLKYAVSGVSEVISVLGVLFQAGSLAFSGIRDQVKATYDAVSGFVDILVKALELAGKVASAIPGASSLLGGAKAAVSSVTGGGGGTSNVSQQNQTTINVNGADQPQSLVGKVANAVSDTLEQQKRNALGAITSLF